MASSTWSPHMIWHLLFVGSDVASKCQSHSPQHSCWKNMLHVPEKYLFRRTYKKNACFKKYLIKMNVKTGDCDDGRNENENGMNAHHQVRDDKSPTVRSTSTDTDQPGRNIFSFCLPSHCYKFSWHIVIASNREENHDLKLSFIFKCMYFTNHGLSHGLEVSASLFHFSNSLFLSNNFPEFEIKDFLFSSLRIIGQQIFEPTDPTRTK